MKIMPFDTFLKIGHMLFVGQISSKKDKKYSVSLAWLEAWAELGKSLKGVRGRGDYSILFGPNGVLAFPVAVSIFCDYSSFFSQGPALQELALGNMLWLSSGSGWYLMEQSE